MTHRWIGLVIVSVALGGSTIVAAQDLLPCQPLAPGARCGAKPGSHVWQLDFGAPKPAPAPPLETQHWQWLGATHRDTSNRLMPAPMLVVPGLLDAPVDCKMVKPGDPSVDPKFVVPHRGHAVLSGRVITVAPCKAK